MGTITDFETFMIDEGFDRIFRMLEKRTPGDWTPKEMDEKYPDQDHYVSLYYTKIKIVEAIELPDKDILIGYKVICSFDDLDIDRFPTLPIQYRKLSRIELSFDPADMDEGSW